MTRKSDMVSSRQAAAAIHRHHDDEKPWWQHALLASFAGLLFAMFLTLVILLCSAAGLGFVQNVESFGTDLTVAARSKLVETPGSKFNYLFIDVDEEACTLRNTPAECRLQNPMSPALVADLAAAAQRAEVAAVIVDRAPYEGADLAAFRAEMTARKVDDDQTWIIVPVYARLREGAQSYWGDQALDLVPDSTGALKMVAFGPLSDGDRGDGKIRRFTAVSKVFDASGQGKSDRFLLTAPYLAYLRLMAENGDPEVRRCALHAIDARYFQRAEPDVGRCPAERANIARVLPDGETAANSIAIDYTMTSLWAVSVRNPSLDKGRQDAEIATAQMRAQDRSYDRIPAAKLWNEQTAKFELPGHLKGSVVVLGSSQDGAGDIHQTPAGLMTGSEIILNAVRTLVEHPSAAAFREEPPASVFRVVFDRLVDLLPGFAIMTVTWLGIYFLLSRKSTSRGGWLVARTGVLVLFLLGLSLSLLVELILMSPSWLSDEPEAAPIDIVTPILALGLEAYADIAKLIVEKIEHYLDLALSALTSNIAWLRNRPIHPTVNENEDP